MAITSVTKDGDAISFVEDGVLKKISITGSDIVVSFPIQDTDRVIAMHRRQSDGVLVLYYFDANGDKQELELDPAGVGDMLKSVYDTDDNGIVDNSEGLEGSTKSQVQDHTPKAHTLGSHSTKAHSELTGVGASDHHPIGIADGDVLSVDDAAAQDNQFARFTANGLEGLTVAEAITFLLASSLPENVAVILASDLADGKYSGIVEGGIAGTDLAFGDLVYFDGVGNNKKWELTDADAEATAFGKIGICIESALNNSPTTILLWGKVRADAVFPTLTIGAPAYIHTTAGEITTTAPSGSGDIVRIIGYGNRNTNELFFCPDNTYVEI